MVRLYAVKLLGYRTHHLQTTRRRVLLPLRRYGIVEFNVPLDTV